MAEHGVCIETDGTIKVGDLANPYVITPTQIASYAAGKTAAQLEATINGFLNPLGFMVLVQSISPLKYSLHNSTTPPSATVRTRLGI